MRLRSRYAITHARQETQPGQEDQTIRPPTRIPPTRPDQQVNASHVDRCPRLQCDGDIDHCWALLDLAPVLVRTQAETTR